MLIMLKELKDILNKKLLSLMENYFKVKLIMIQHSPHSQIICSLGFC